VLSYTFRLAPSMMITSLWTTAPMKAYPTTLSHLHHMMPFMTPKSPLQPNFTSLPRKRKITTEKYRRASNKGGRSKFSDEHAEKYPHIQVKIFPPSTIHQYANFLEIHKRSILFLLLNMPKTFGYVNKRTYCHRDSYQDGMAYGACGGTAICAEFYQRKCSEVQQAECVCIQG
jgi:hypothetical protein